MRRINAEIQGGKVQEYWRISSLSDAEVQYLDKQKIQDLVGGSILHLMHSQTAIIKGEHQSAF